MKNLLFLINGLLLIFWLVPSCHTNKSTKDTNYPAAPASQPDSLRAVQGVPVATDSSHQSKGGKVEKAGAGQQTGKKNGAVKEAPKHNSPEQGEIDSIKQAKDKLKKR